MDQTKLVDAMMALNLRRLLRLGVIVAVSTPLLSGFAVSQNSKPDPHLKGKYRTIEVTKFEVAKDVEIPDNQINVLMLEIVDELYKLKKFDQIINPSSKGSPTPVSTSEPTIRLVGTFTRYYALLPEKDSMSVGEIWTHVRVKVRFLDTADGKELIEKEIDRRVFFGPYQFYLGDVTRKAAKEIAKITKKTFF